MTPDLSEKPRKQKHKDLTGREEEIMPILFERMAGGESLLAICRDENWNRASINKWAYSPRWKEEYIQARQALGSWWGDRVVEAAEQAALEKDHAKIAGLRVLVDALKWSAARLHFKEYGEFKALDITSGGKQLGGVIALPAEDDTQDGEFEPIDDPEQLPSPPPNLLPDNDL